MPAGSAGSANLTWKSSAGRSMMIAGRSVKGCAIVHGQGIPEIDGPKTVRHVGGPLDADEPADAAASTSEATRPTAAEATRPRTATEFSSNADPLRTPIFTTEAMGSAHGSAERGGAAPGRAEDPRRQVCRRLLHRQGGDGRGLEGEGPGFLGR